MISLDTLALYLVPACGVLLMLVTWPTGGTGRRLLRRWCGLTQPDDAQVAAAVRYLRLRRALMLPLTMLAPLAARVVATFLGGASDLGLYDLLGALLIALLLAEALAGVRRPRGSVRTASLARRDWSGLLPRSAVGLHLALTALAIGLAALGLAVHGPAGWSLIAGTLLGLLVVYGIGWLALRRPATDDEPVDTALRLRGARVAAGIGILLAALLAAAGANRLSALTRVDLVPVPGWLHAVAPVTGWLALAGTALALWGWSSVISAPRRAA